MSELPFLAGEEGRGSFLVLLFFVSAAAVTGWGIWEGTLPRSEEAVYAEMAREISATGEMWTVYFDGQPVLDTPPLPLWTTALCIRLFGAHEFAARLCFVAFSILAFWFVYLAGMRTELWDSGGAGKIRCGSAVGLLAAIILASSPLFARFAPHLAPDVPFACFVAISLLGWWYLPARRFGLALWGIGIVGGLLSVGSACLFVVPASLISLLADRRRRAVWQSAGFIAVTAAALVLGGYWPLSTALKAADGIRSSPLWGAVFGFVDPSGRVAIDLLNAVKDLSLRNLPWSIPAVVAVVRVLFMRVSRRRYGYTAADDTLVVFAVVLFVPILFSRPAGAQAYLPLLPLAAILSARELARWLTPAYRVPASGPQEGGSSTTPEAGPQERGSGTTPAPEALSAGGMRRSDAKEFVASRIWSFNQVLVALFCLLMLLLAATPLRLHRTRTDPIKEIAVMAGSLVPEGVRLANYRQGYREQAARLMFYGGRSLGPALRTPAEVAAVLSEDPGRIFFAAAEDLGGLERSGAVPGGVKVFYRAGDLVLFGKKETGGTGQTQ